MITGFNHTSFTVTDIDRSVRFWRDALGFAVASVSPRTGDWQERVTGVPGAQLMVAHLYGYGQHMEFIQYLEPRGETQKLEPNAGGAAHICLEVDDIDKTWNELITAGATPQGEPVEVNSGSVACKAGYLRDPNGVIIELLEMTDGSPR
jgi:catechol 2,3-dioxygenase-like lactoylglutathione lyase family enzyme